MSDLTSVLFAEISRLARKEIKKELSSVLQYSRNQKKRISSLQKRVDVLEREINKLRKTTGKTISVDTENSQGTRLSPVLLKKLRKRLKISQSDLARLVQASPPAVASWEQGRVKPRVGTREKIIALRQQTPASVRELLSSSAARPEGKSKQRRKRRK